MSVTDPPTMDHRPTIYQPITHPPDIDHRPITYSLSERLADGMNNFMICDYLTELTSL